MELTDPAHPTSWLWLRIVVAVADALALTFAQRMSLINNKDEITFGREFGHLGSFGGTWMGT